MIVLLDIVKFIILILITFFSCQIITDGKKRISYIGTLLICFSSAIIEYINLGLVEAIIFGELIFWAFENLLTNIKYRILYAIIIPIRYFRIFIIIKH